MTIAFDNPLCPQTPYVLLEDSLNPEEDITLFQAPHQLIEAHQPSEVAPAFVAIEAALKDGHYVAGFMTYELGLALEPKLQPRLSKNTPLLWFGVFKEKTVATPQMVTDWLEENHLGEQKSDPDDQLKLHVKESQPSYEKKFNQVQAAIKAGDIYQLNLTFKASIEGLKTPLKLYQKIRRSQPVAYAALIDTGRTTYLSASPELFIKNNQGQLETRPMKGTIKRAPSSQEDQSHRQFLQRDEKSKAENLMIVDLMRNDISRIAQTGTVKVEDLFKVETYHSLHQMISVIKAKQSPDISLYEQMRALFPPGSITGAPKIRAMELIDDLETEPRGIYTGAIGHFSPDGTYCFNVAIRTVECPSEGKATFGIGSGLVFDSKARDEYEECLLKMQFLTTEPPEFSLIETMAYHPNQGLLYQDEHFERLTRSANYFHYKFNQEALEEQLTQITAPLKAATRLRILLNASGTVSITTTELSLPSPNETWPIIWAGTPQDSTNPFLYHKTTNRAFYDEARTKAQDNNSAIKEVIFINERGEVTEGSFTNLFVEQQGRLLTPPISSGLLPGTLRENLLKTGQVEEKVLFKDDVQSADTLYLGNSVRGLIKATLVE